MLKAPYVTNYLTEHFGDDSYGTLEGYERLGGDIDGAEVGAGEAMVNHAIVTLYKLTGKLRKVPSR